MFFDKTIKWLLYFYADIKCYDVVLWKTNDCEPYEWTKESNQRFTRFVQFWNEYGPFHILISGGIPNSVGKTIAHAIKERMTMECPGSEQYFLHPAETKSSDTAGEVIYGTRIFKKHYRKYQQFHPRLFVLSNFWHLKRLFIQFLYKGIIIRQVISPTSGGISFRLKRFLNEIVLLGVTIFDPNYRLWFFKKERERRKDKAKTRNLKDC